MKTKTSKISTVLFLSILISFNAYAQWIYPDAEPIEDDVMIIYEVKYDRALTEKEQQSPMFKKEVIVVFNNNKLLEKSFIDIGEYETFTLLDYEKEMAYKCYKYDKKGTAISSEFKNPIKETVLQEGKVDTILGLPCQVSTTKINDQDREIYTTNEFGLKYVKKHKTEGFLMKYVAEDKWLGTYTVTAKKIFYTDEVNEAFYSLEGYRITTKVKNDAYRKERKEITRLAKEEAIEKIGTSAPTFSARSINGKKLKSKDMKGKVVVLNFWYTLSTSSKKEIPYLNKLKEKYKDENVEFIAVAYDAEYKLGKFLEQHPFTYDIVEDGQWIADKFEIKSYPSNIIIDQNGTIQFYKIGYKTDIVETWQGRPRIVSSLPSCNTVSFIGFLNSELIAVPFLSYL
jgi:peroxiredoxin